MQKGGPLKFLTLVRGAVKKITKNFPVKIEFKCFSMGLICNFNGKKGGPEIFKGLKRALKNFHDFFFLHQAPLIQVFVDSPSLMDNKLSRSYTYFLMRLKQLVDWSLGETLTMVAWLTMVNHGWTMVDNG